MKTPRPLLGVLGCLCLFATVLPAQVPQIISYQGRFAVGTTNFHGTGAFKFALVNSDGNTTYWSNDGASAAGSEPTVAVALTVVKGLYSVLLGDTTLANMTAIPNSVFANSDVRLRVWFDDGTNGSQLLTPDQRIAAVGYAMFAGNVPDGAITSAKIATGAVGSAQIAAGAVGNVQLGAGAVQSAHIAAGAVTTTQIAPGTIGFTSLAKPPQAGTISGASLSFDFGQADFAVTFPQAYPAFPVVTLSLAAGSGVLLRDATAQVMAANATQFTGRLFNAFASGSRAVDGFVGDVGQYTALGVVNGNPAISFYDVSNGDLKYTRASDPNGTAWTVSITVDSTGNVGQSTSLAVVNGNPAISSYDATNRNLKYVRANDADGTSWGAPLTLASAGDVGRDASLAVVNGNPAIGYLDATNNVAKYIRATNPEGATWGTPVTVDGVGGLYTSLSVVNGRPALSYLGGSGTLKYARATDANGMAWSLPVTLDSTGSVGSFTALAVIGGSPAISYYDSTKGDLKFIRQATPPSNFVINWIAIPP